MSEEAIVQETPEAVEPQAEQADDSSDLSDLFNFGSPEEPSSETESPDAPEVDAVDTPEAEAPEVEATTHQTAMEKLEARDRDLFERQAQIKAQESRINEYNQLKEMAQKDPAKAIRMLGMDPMELADGMAGIEKPKPAPEIQRLEDKISEMQTQLKVREAERAKMIEIDRISQAIKAGGDKLGVISSLSAASPEYAKNAFNMASKYWQDTGNVPDYNNILQQYEDNVTSEILGMLQNVSKVDKIKQGVQKMFGINIESKTEQVKPKVTLGKKMDGESPSTNSREHTPEETQGDIEKAFAGLFGKAND